MVSGVIVMAGGEVLLGGAAVADVGRALRLGARVAARGGIRISPGMHDLLTAVDEAERAAAGTSEYPPEPPAPPLPDELSASEAAALLGCTARNVRARCQRCGFTTARFVAGRWLIDRAELLARQERQS